MLNRDPRIDEDEAYERALDKAMEDIYEAVPTDYYDKLPSQLQNDMDMLLATIASTLLQQDWTWPPNKRRAQLDLFYD